MPLELMEVSGFSRVEILGGGDCVYWQAIDLDWCQLLFDLPSDQVPEDEVRQRVIEDACKQLIASALGLDAALVEPLTPSLSSPPLKGPWSEVRLQFEAGRVDVLAPNTLLAASFSGLARVPNSVKLVDRKESIENSICELKVGFSAGQISYGELRRLKVGDVLGTDRDLSDGVVVAINERPIMSGLPCKHLNKLAVVLD